MRTSFVIIGLLFVALAAAMLSLTGCDERRDDTRGVVQVTQKHVPFNHKVHVVQEEIKCDICHKTASKEEHAGMPTFKSCTKCHEGIDAKKPPERRIDKFLVDNKPEWAHVTTPKTIAPDTIKFSHKTHVDAKVQCATCHKGAENATSLTSKLRVTMKECIDCHKQTHVGENVSNNCQICHTYINKQWKPESHLVNWKQLHGREIGFASKELTANCEMCHTLTSCTKCHREEAPQNHTNFWRQRGHGITADLDRAQCKVCHTEDSCLRCHTTVAPQSHKGNFSANHCGTCHFPLKEEGCFACHKDTKSHLQADKLPVNKVHQQATAATCRDCHFGIKMLPHQDNGDSCLMCHKR